MKKMLSLLGILSAVCVFLFAWRFQTTTEEPTLEKFVAASTGEKDDPEARLRHEWMMLRDPATGEIPNNIRQKELAFARNLPTREQVNALSKGATTQAATWISRGPWNVGGRTRALAIDAANTNHMLAGGASGGMWSSNDGGATWAKTTALADLHSVTCIAQDTRAGQTSTWYYGTGEALGNSTSGGGAFYAGYGIYKSVNNGASWTRLPVDNGDPQNFDKAFDFVWNVVINPTNGNLYAAVLGAIYRSTDAGATWSLVLGGTGTINSTMCTDIQITSTGRMYVTGASNSSMAGIWTSTTGASGSWTALTPTGGFPTTYARIVIGIAPSNENSVYFLLGPAPGQPSNPSTHRIWKYSATGGTWSTRVVPALGGQTGEFDSQGSYDLLIKVKPDNENTVVIGGTNLFLSTDGFTSATPNWIGGYTSANNSYASYPNHHADQHSFVFIPGGSIAYSGHDGGISKTTNILASTVAWTFLNNGYLTTQCYTVALDHTTSGSNQILTGLQDNGVWQGSSASGTSTWSQEFGGDGAFVAFSNGGTSRYVSSQNGNTYRLFGTSQFARVDPGGTSYLFINPFILDPNNSSIMYMANGTGVMRCSDVTAIPEGNNPASAASWPQLSGSVSSGPVSALGISTANPPNRLFAGTQGGDLKKVDNANTGNPAGVEVGGSLPSGNISSVAVDPTNGDKVLVVFSNYNLVSLWYTANGGTTWTDVEGNLSGTTGPSCRYAAIVPYNGTTTFFVATSVGLYSTTALNGSSTVWAREGNTSIGSVVVTFLDYRTVDGIVIAGTHANGVYSAALSGGGGGGTTTTVYAGDANNDAGCDIRDLLPIGRFFGATGPARTGGSLTWSAQTATIWTTADATYADCNGNGTVEANDVEGLINNYGRSRSAFDNPEPDKIKVCKMLLTELDRQPAPSREMLEIRNAIVAYMQRELGITFAFALDQNYPNPFNPSTTIRFTVPQRTERVQLAVYDIAGKQVWTKVMNDTPTGMHEVVWNGITSNGSPASSGIYVYRLSAGNFSAAKRMLMIK